MKNKDIGVFLVISICIVSLIIFAWFSINYNQGRNFTGESNDNKFCQTEYFYPRFTESIEYNASVLDMKEHVIQKNNEKNNVSIISYHAQILDEFLINGSTWRIYRLYWTEERTKEVCYS